jgi:hypothetical protein
LSKKYSIASYVSLQETKFPNTLNSRDFLPLGPFPTQSLRLGFGAKPAVSLPWLNDSGGVEQAPRHVVQKLARLLIDVPFDDRRVGTRKFAPAARA